MKSWITLVRESIGIVQSYALPIQWRSTVYSLRQEVIKTMKYIFFLSIQVIKETLRRHPPATGNIRKIEQGQDVGGYKIPTDVAIIVQYFCTCLFL